MPLNDCDPVTTLEIIDSSLTMAGVTITGGALTSAAATVPAVFATWTASTSAYVLGIQFEYVPQDASAGPKRTAVQGNALAAWNATDGIVAGKNYNVRWRAAGTLDNAFGNWSGYTTVTVSSSQNSSGLSQGGSINTGGSTALPASIEPISLSLADGDVVTFSQTYPIAPLVVFTSAGLSPLAVTQSYYFNAESLSGSGFTARIKKRTPGTPTYTTQTDSTGSMIAADDWQLHKSRVDDAYNGAYTFSFSVSIVCSYFGPGDYGGDITVSIQVRPGGTGSWITIGAKIVHNNTFTSGTHTFAASGTWTTGYAVGQGAGTEFRILVTNRDDPANTISAFTSVSWQYQSAGAAPTDVSATPNGERSLVLVTPLNS